MIRRAEELGVPVFTDVAPQAVRQVTDDLRPDCVVVSSYNRLPAEVLATAKCVNVHATALPLYRGRGEWPILNGESFTALTIHVVEAEADTGNILFQEIVPIGSTDSVADLYERLNDVQRRHLGGRSPATSRASRERRSGMRRRRTAAPPTATSAADGSPGTASWTGPAPPAAPTAWSAGSPTRGRARTPTTAANG